MKLLAASLNAQGFNPSVTAARSHLPIFDLGKVGDALQVSVISRSVTVEGATRTCNFFDVSTDIGVQKRVDPNDPSQIDALLDLVELLHSWGAFLVYAGFSAVGGVWMYYYLPETMNLSLEEVATLFRDPYPAPLRAQQARAKVAAPRKEIDKLLPK